MQNLKIAHQLNDIRDFFYTESLEAMCSTLYSSVQRKPDSLTAYKIDCDRSSSSKRIQIANCLAILIFNFI